MKHLRNIAAELVERLSREGLNGLEFFTCEVNPATKPGTDGLSRELADAWDRDYAIMTFAYDTEIYDGSEYVEFNHDRFYREFKEVLDEAFGAQIFKDMFMESGRPWSYYLATSGEVEVYRRSSPWHDFEGNKHIAPLDPLTCPPRSQ